MECEPYCTQLGEHDGTYAKQGGDRELVALMTDIGESLDILKIKLIDYGEFHLCWEGRPASTGDGGERHCLLVRDRAKLE